MDGQFEGCCNLEMLKLELIHRKPTSSAVTLSAPPLLFLHGGWHAAWCWKSYQDFFAANGIESYAVSHRGHGASQSDRSIRCIGLEEYLQDVDSALVEIKRPPIFVAHSMGGYIVQKYLESHTCPAAVLLAPLPVTGIIPMMLRLSIRYPWLSLQVHARLNASLYVKNMQKVREMFFSQDIPREHLQECFSKLGKESYKIGWDMGLFQLPKPKKVNAPPMLILAGENDRLFSRRELERTSRAYSADFEVLKDTAHDIMLEERGQPAAQKILAWLKSKKLLTTP